MNEDTFRMVVTLGIGIAVLSIMVIAVAALAMLKSVKLIRARMERLATQAEPILQSVRSLTEENGPHIGEIVLNVKQVSHDAKHISGMAKDQVHNFAEVGRDIAERTRAQVSRIDSVVDNTIDLAYQKTEDVKAAVMMPIREVSGIAAGVKAAVSTLAQGSRARVNRATQDEEMFI